MSGKPSSRVRLVAVIMAPLLPVYMVGWIHCELLGREIVANQCVVLHQERFLCPRQNVLFANGSTIKSVMYIFNLKIRSTHRIKQEVAIMHGTSSNVGHYNLQLSQ